MYKNETPVFIVTRKSSPNVGNAEFRFGLLPGKFVRVWKCPRRRVINRPYVRTDNFSATRSRTGLGFFSETRWGLFINHNYRI